MDPERVKAAAAQAAGDADAERPLRRNDVAPPQRGQEFVAIAVEQRHVPTHDLAEAGIAMPVQRALALEEDGEIDVRRGGDEAEQRRLILDRMRDEVGETVTAGGRRGDHEGRILRPV